MAPLEPLDDGMLDDGWRPEPDADSPTTKPATFKHVPYDFDFGDDDDHGTPKKSTPAPGRRRTTSAKQSTPASRPSGGDNVENPDQPDKKRRAVSGDSTEARTARLKQLQGVKKKMSDTMDITARRAREAKDKEMVEWLSKELPPLELQKGVIKAVRQMMDSFKF